MLNRSSVKQYIGNANNVFICLIMLLALLTRLYYIYAYPSVRLSHDEIGYHRMAMQFLHKGFLGYYSEKPDAFVTPGYPLFLAAVYWMAAFFNAPPLITIRVVQVIISVGSVFLVYLIAEKSGLPRVGIIAAIISAVYLPSFMANNRVLTEVVFTSLLLGYILSLITAFEKLRIGWHILAGVIMAVAVLVRPTVIIFFPVPYLVQFTICKNFRYLTGLMIATAALCLVMTPWWVRNYLVFDKFIVFATQSGNPLLRGADPYDPYDRKGPSIIKNVPEDQMTLVAVKRIKKGLKDNPRLWIKWFTIGKLSFLWLKPWGVYGTGARTLHFGVIVIMGWAGTLTNLFDPRMRWPALVIIVLTVVQLAFIPIERYIYPLTPLMAVMASTLLAKIAQRHLTLRV